MQRAELVSGVARKNGLVVRLASIDSRNAAEQLTGEYIYVRADTLAPPEEGETYWRDLIGMAVENTRGEKLGVIAEMLETGANDVMLVAAEDAAAPEGQASKAVGNRHRAIPWISTVVREVDISERRVLVDWETDY